MSADTYVALTVTRRQIEKMEDLLQRDPATCTDEGLIVPHLYSTFILEVVVPLLSDEAVQDEVKRFLELREQAGKHFQTRNADARI
jgi:hypothetical protein